VTKGNLLWLIAPPTTPKNKKNETNEKWVARGQKATPNVNCQGARPLSLATCCVDTKTAVTVAQPIHGFPD